MGQNRTGPKCTEIEMGQNRTGPKCTRKERKMERRVVITGLGAITPIGNNVDDFWKGIKNGEIKSSNS